MKTVDMLESDERGHREAEAHAGRRDDALVGRGLRRYGTLGGFPDGAHILMSSAAGAELLGEAGFLASGSR